MDDSLDPAEKRKVREKWVQENLKHILDDMVAECICEMPEDPGKFMTTWLEAHIAKRDASDAKRTQRRTKLAHASQKIKEKGDRFHLTVKAAVSQEKLKAQEKAPPIVGSVTEPTGKHTASIICLHGCGDVSEYWKPLYECFARAGVCHEGIRWICLQAPKRDMWDDIYNAWFLYTTCKDGEDEEDEFAEGTLLAMRGHLHAIIDKEVEALRDQGGASRVVLAGSSQGGQVGLDAALTYPELVGGVCLLRSLAMARSVEDARPGRRVPLLAVSGKDDDTFLLSLVQRNLTKASPHTEQEAHVLEDLEHMTEYDARETAIFMDFLEKKLQLGRKEGFPACTDPACFEGAFPEPKPEEEQEEGEEGGEEKP